MCHGHPHHHPCGHQSVRWHYCPKARIDLETGYETACDKTTFAISQPSNKVCPLKSCGFKAHGGSWQCCTCSNGPNTQGWCAFSRPHWELNAITGDWAWIQSCDHGCCKSCTTTAPKAATKPATATTETGGRDKKGSNSRKSEAKAKSRAHSHKRVAAPSGDRLLNLDEGVEDQAEDVDGGDLYDIQLDYASKENKSKAAAHKIKGHRRRH